MKKPITIAIYPHTSDQLDHAGQLARRLGLPIADLADQYDYQLIVTATHLGLKKTGTKSLPLCIDFLSAELTYRRLNTHLRHEILARAMGLKSHSKPFIVDATAGLARDSFILASLGFEVLLLERSPIIHALLENAIWRAEQDKEIGPIIQRLKLIHEDAISWMQKINTTRRPHIIYLDPMFPERSKSALVKKDMQILHDIIGEDADTDNLLQAALACASKRVVVKRPRLAAYLTGPAPSFSLTGSSSRFDIYLRV